MRDEKEDTDRARKDKTEQHSATAAPCSSELCGPSWEKREIYTNVLCCNLSPCMLLSQSAALLAAAPCLSASLLTGRKDPELLWLQGRSVSLPLKTPTHQFWMKGMDATVPQYVVLLFFILYVFLLLLFFIFYIFFSFNTHGYHPTLPKQISQRMKGSLQAWK